MQTWKIFFCGWKHDFSMIFAHALQSQTVFLLIAKWWQNFSVLSFRLSVNHRSQNFATSTRLTPSDIVTMPFRQLPDVRMSSKCPARSSRRRSRQFSTIGRRWRLPMATERTHDYEIIDHPRFPAHRQNESTRLSDNESFKSHDLINSLMDRTRLCDRWQPSVYIGWVTDNGCGN